MATKTIDSNLQVNGRITASGSEGDMDIGYSEEVEAFQINFPANGSLYIGNSIEDTSSGRVDFMTNPWAEEYRLYAQSTGLRLVGFDTRGDQIRFMVGTMTGDTKRPLLGVGSSTYNKEGIFSIALGDEQLTIHKGVGMSSDYLFIDLNKDVAGDLVIDGELLARCMVGIPNMILAESGKYQFGFHYGSAGFIFSLNPGRDSSLPNPALYTYEEATMGTLEHPWFIVYSKKFIVPNGTNKQFLKADGSLDSTEYATVAELTTAQNNAWKLREANAEVETVVLQLTNKGIFETMTAAKINPLTSRNIYVDLSKAESTLDIFAGYKDLPVGVRYHIFFGNTSQDVKLNWTEAEIESNIAGGTIGLTPAYPTAKCEFMRVTEAWTYADWEAKIENVSHVVDTGTLDDTNNSILQGYLDKNGISYEKTAKGSLFNLANMLAALAGSK